MSTPFPSPRGLLRRFTLGSGPLKRRSDRVEVLSRIVLVVALFLAGPLAVVVGTTMADGLTTTAERQAAGLTQQQATLLADAAAEPAPGAQTVPTSATWLGPGAVPRVGTVAAPPGARSGSAVSIWVDRTGAPAKPPISAAVVADQALVAGAVTFLGVIIAGLSLHLLVLWQLGRRRARRWEAGWALVEPLWVSRFR